MQLNQHLILFWTVITSLVLVSGCQSTQPKNEPQPKNNQQTREEPEPQIVETDPNASANDRPPLHSTGVLLPLDELESQQAKSATRQAPSQPEVSTPKQLSPEERVAADIRGYLEEVANLTGRMESYTLSFVRYERRRSGFSWKLSGPENIKAWFRREPFSVKLKWLNDDLKYDESVFVSGEHDDMVRFVTRKPVFLLKPPPQINLIDTQTPVLLGETKRPITEFGLEGLLRRTITSLETDADLATQDYRGIVKDPEYGQKVHHIRLSYPRPENEPSIQDLYIHVETNLPTGTELRFADETLDGGYYYTDIDASVALVDDDFLLSVEQAPPAAGDAVSMKND